MAYAAVISLKHTMEQLMQPSCYDARPPAARILEFAYKELNSLHFHLKFLDSKKICVKALDEEGLIQELSKMEDLIESHLSNQLLISQPQPQVGKPFYVDLQDLKPEISSFAVALKKMKLACLEIKSWNTDDDDVADDDDISSRIKIVGLYSDQLSSIKRGLSMTNIFSVVGMAGIGKTTLAKQIFEDPDMVERFDFEHRVWVRLDKLIAQGDEKDMCLDLRNFLRSKRCFIVLDDVWDAGFVGSMDLPNKICGSRVLLTTRLQQVAVKASSFSLNMELLNKQESWHLFCAKVFGEELCPHELMKPGKKIVKKCEGLPLLIVTLANLLSNKEKNPENWNNIAQDKRNRLLKDACKEIEEVLFPSYDHLPQHLKMCFLYMGAFPQDYEIPKSNIINLWTAEGFLELSEYESSEFCAKKCLNELVSNNVLLVCQRTSRCSSNSISEIFDIVKTCGLHCSFWHLCNREAEKNKFHHVINNSEDGLEEGIKGHRRLSIHNNVLFGIKDVHSSIERVGAFTARSLLCFGAYHEYAVPMCFGLRFLKVLDALALRFYDFPSEVMKLVLMRYLSVTCNGKLPPCITQLRRLELLIIGRHLSIKTSRAPSYLPMEIWDMKVLQHLQIMGSDLPDPCGAWLPKLLRLIGVSAHSCTKEVLQGITNLEKLGILIELEPNATEPLCCFDHTLNLCRLRSLKCIAVNPMFVTPPVVAPFRYMPLSLSKLHLSGLGYPWEYMTVVASLPYLKDLKLRCYAFRGPKWEIEENHFPELISLLIEDTDLVQLKAGRGSFPKLRRISMKHCYRLQELHLELENCDSLKQIELVDCNPVAVNYVQQAIKGGSIRIPGDGLVVHCSWNDGKLKSSQATNWPKRKFLKAR